MSVSVIIVLAGLDLIGVACLVIFMSKKKPKEPPKKKDDDSENIGGVAF